MSRAVAKIVKKYERDTGGLGISDCLHFTLEASAAMGKKDYRKIVPKYSSPAEAFRWLYKNKYKTLSGCFDAFFTRIPPLHAMPGDIVLDPDGNPTFGWVGVVVGGQAAFIKPGTGLILRKFTHLTTWRVPDASTSS